MNPRTTNYSLDLLSARILAGLFILFICLPALDSCFKFDPSPAPNEKRVLAVFPDSTTDWRGLKNYLAQLGSYFDDHFGCRKCLVRWHNRLKWKLFKDMDVRHAIIGTDGWFYWAAEQMVEHYSGARQWSSEELHDWQILLERRRDWLAQQNIKFLFVVTPDKSSVYPDFLPAWLKKVRPETKLDQFISYMRTHSTVAILDLRDPLRNARQIAPTYLKTDTHWNLFGGFIGYQEVINSLAQQLPGLTPLSLTAFEQKQIATPGGDTVSYLGINVPESNEVSFTPMADLPPLTTSQAPASLPTSPVFTENPHSKDSLMVFRDSFAVAWVPFLGYHFKRVDYLWQYSIDPNLIQEKKPLAVVSEMLERFFNIANPKELMAKEALQ